MPKMKTRRGAAKRVKRTANGHLKRSQAYAGHLLTKKTTKRKRGLRQSTLVSNSDMKRVKTLVPYL